MIESRGSTEQSKTSHEIMDGKGGDTREESSKLTNEAIANKLNRK